MKQHFLTLALCQSGKVLMLWADTASDTFCCTYFVIIQRLQCLERTICLSKAKWPQTATLFIGQAVRVFQHLWSSRLHATCQPGKSVWGLGLENSHTDTLSQLKWSLWLVFTSFIPSVCGEWKRMKGLEVEEVKGNIKNQLQNQERPI